MIKSPVMISSAFLPRRLTFAIDQPTVRQRNRSCRVWCTAPNGSLEKGVRVRVVKSIVVYHVPKAKDGLDIEGMEGSVVSDVRHTGDQELTPNYPWKVQFEGNSTETGKRSKFFVHLGKDEIEVMKETV